MKYIKEIKILPEQLDILLHDRNLYISEINVTDNFYSSRSSKYNNFLLKNKDLIIKNKIISLLIDLSKLIKNMNEKNEIKKIILEFKSPQLIFNYIDIILIKPWKEAEEILLLDLDVAFNYVYNIKQKRWPELEEKLYLDPMKAAMYAYLILDEPWVDAKIKPDLLKKIEDSISNNLEAASYYIQHVVNEWPQGEKILATNAKSAVDYASRIHKRFLAGEKIISTSPKDAVDYAWIILNKPWSESKEIDSEISKTAEKNIASYPQASFQYAKKVLKGRWKQGENSILQNKEVLIKYIKEIITEPWKEAEHILSKDAEVAYEYAKKLERRFIAGEPIIADSPFRAYVYSKNVLTQKWKDVEGIDPKIVKKAEDSIKNSEYNSFYNRDEF